LTATVVSGTQVNLAWGASSDNKGVTGYNVYRCLGSSCTYYVTAPTNDRTARVTNLTPGTTYRFMVSAHDAAGNVSDGSSVSATTWDTIAPSAPGNLGASTASPTQINLSWSAASDNVAVVEYLLEYCAGAGCSSFSSFGTTTSTNYTAGGLSQATSYTFRVRARDAYPNYSGYSNNASATTQDGTPPSTPTSFSATAASGTQINLSWSASSDNVAVAAYDLEYCAGSGCSNFSGLTSTGSTSYSVGGLTPATSYSFRVRARDAFPNYSGYSSTASATTIDTVSPSTPASLSASAASGTQINLSWSASSDNVGVSGYSIEWCSGSGCSSWSTLTTTGSTSYSPTGLTPATSYSFRVRAYDARTNYGGYSPTASATTQDSVAPSAPTGLGASAASATQINLSWTASTDNVGVVAYHIERCQGASCSNFAEIATTSGTSYSNTGLTDATSYSYRVRARDAFPNYSSFSGVATAATPDGTAPSAPTGLSASVAAATQINLAWNASNDNVAVTGYAVERCQGASCTNFAQIATPSTNSYSDTTVSSGLTYRYQVRARDAVPNWSGYSSIASATTTDNVAPSVPSGVVATPVSATQVNLSWAASSDNVAVVAYSVERCTGASCSSFSEIGTPSGTSFNDTGRAPGPTYRYRVRARDAGPLYSGYSATADAITPTDNQAPSVPTGVTATVISTTQINLSWAASTDNVAVTAYVVERCTGSGCSSFSQIATPTTPSYSDTGRAPSTTYRYQIRARDAVPNTSGASSIVSGTTPADTAAPSAPTGLGVSVVSPT
jgi:chitodextrinase